ncbi:4-amino-4-deoxy-L-arabinose transferase-like glycosyltransferase [Hymenobacter sp. UYAg731]
MGPFLRHLWAKRGVDLYQTGLLMALVVLLVWNVGVPVLHDWDEARLAVNASEMLRTGDWLITHYDGHPDLWNTKPPLLIWLQAASLYVLGYSMWAIRLPSVVAALATAWLLYRFGCYTLGSRFVGTFAALILATSPGYNGMHVARFGDYDALLVLGLTATALNWYQYAQQRRAGRLWRGAAWFALALLTKSAAALLLLPAVALALLLEPASRWVFGQWRTYAAVAVAVVPLAVFYSLREAAAPGYLAATWFNDWYGRLSQRIVTVNYPWWIYIQRLLFPGLLTWVWLLPVGSWLGFSAAAGATPTRRFARFASVYVFVFLIILSMARTRLWWYSAPVYPMAALLCALGLAHLVRQARHRWHWPKPATAGLLVLAAVVPAAVLLRHEWTRWEAEKTDPMLQYGYQLPRIVVAYPTLYTFNILREPGYHTTLNFYLAALHAQGVSPIEIIGKDAALQQLKPGQRLLVCSALMQRYVQQHYRTQPLESVAPCVFLEILGSK